MIIAIILILFAVGLFLVFHDDHDDSYTRREKDPRRKEPKSFYDKSASYPRSASYPKPASYPDAAPKSPVTQTAAPQVVRPVLSQEARTVAPPVAPTSERAPLDFSFLDRITFDADLPERTMSSFIAGIGSRCSHKDLGGLFGWISVDPVTEAMEVYASDGRQMGFLPMKDKVAYHTFNPDWVDCPFAGHVALSVSGRYYADIRIVLPSSRDFVQQQLTGFLG